MTGIINENTKDDLSREDRYEGSTIPADTASDQKPPVTLPRNDPDQALETPPREKKIRLKGVIKCKDCINNKSEQPEIVLEQQGTSGLLSIKFSGRCECPYRIIINREFELVEHSCASYKSREKYSASFDFDEFLESDKEIDDVLEANPVRPVQKLVSIEESMKVAVKKLAKPLALLIPTTAQKKTEEQLRAEREQRMKELVGTEANPVYLRVLEFEKFAASNNGYQIDKFCKNLKNLDKGSLIGFIKKVNNEFLIAFSEKSQIVRFFNPSKPELEILSREFEKWLRFKRL